MPSIFVRNPTSLSFDSLFALHSFFFVPRPGLGFFKVMNIQNGVLAPFDALDQMENQVLSLPKFMEADALQAKHALAMLTFQDEFVTLLHLRRVVQKQRWLRAHKPKLAHLAKFTWGMISVRALPYKPTPPPSWHTAHRARALGFPVQQPYVIGCLASPPSGHPRGLPSGFYFDVFAAGGVPAGDHRFHRRPECALECGGRARQDLPHVSGNPRQGGAPVQRQVRGFVAGLVAGQSGPAKASTAGQWVLGGAPAKRSTVDPGPLGHPAPHHRLLAPLVSFAYDRSALLAILFPCS